MYIFIRYSDLRLSSQEIVTPEVLYKRVVEVRCRVVPALPGKCQLVKDSWRKVKGSTGEDLFVTQELNEEKLKEDLLELKESGIESIAVVLAHSYTSVFIIVSVIYWKRILYMRFCAVECIIILFIIDKSYFRYADHEIRVGELIKEIGFSQISLSHQVMPMTRIVPRGFTTCADAYLTPHIKQYLQV